MIDFLVWIKRWMDEWCSRFFASHNIPCILNRYNITQRGQNLVLEGRVFTDMAMVWDPAKNYITCTI
jgi:hypothetical protein